MGYLREQRPEDGLFRMLYDLMSQLGLSPDYPAPETTPPPAVGMYWDSPKHPPVVGDPEVGPAPPLPGVDVSLDWPEHPVVVDPKTRPLMPGFDVSQGTRPQPPTVVDPRRTPPPPRFNVSQGDRPQPPNIVDPRRPQPSPGMFSPETARSVDLVRQAMLRGGFNRRR